MKKTFEIIQARSLIDEDYLCKFRPNFSSLLRIESFLLIVPVF